MRAWRRSASIRISPTACSSSVWLIALHRLAPVAPRPRPGTATTSPPRTTSGQPSRSERGILASTNTSWIFFERPASRSPGLHPRTIRPGSSDRMRQPPQSTSPRSSTGPRSSQSRSCSRTAWTPPPRSIRREAAGESSSSASAGGIVRRVSSERRMFSRAAGWMLLEQRQDLAADQPARRAGVRRVDAEATPRSRQNASVSSRQSGSSGRTTPSSRRA